MVLFLSNNNNFIIIISSNNNNNGGVEIRFSEQYSLLSQK